MASAATMPAHQQAAAAAAAAEEQGDAKGDLDTIAQLVFPLLPLSVQALTLPALSKAWEEWAEEQRAKERALQEAEPVDSTLSVFNVPLWAAQARQQQGQLSDEQKRRFQLRAAAHGDVAALDVFDVDDEHWHHARMCLTAAQFGQLEALQWLRANRCDWNTFTCGAAAESGHLAVLQWARANGCPWDADTCRMARLNGHLDVLAWARANGCPDVF